MPMSREYKVGIFVICATALVVLALLYLAVAKGLFSTSHTYTLSSRTGDGFAVGMPVVFSGFDIGRVHSLELNDKGIVLIEIRIPDKHVKWIKEDSFFVLYRPLIGAARIVVNTNNLESPPLPEDKVSEVFVVNDINDAIEKIQPLLETIERLSRKIDSMASKADEQIFGKEGTLPQINQILKDVSRKLEILETTVDNLNKISKDAAEGTQDLGALRADIDEVAQTLNKVSRDIDALLYKKKDPEIKLP
jgi:phospholipid/cholesterol/gamma-HCH transport system substrate-binding protein